MKILGIETSCDETAASVIEFFSGNTQVTLLSSVTATSLALHARTGGIIPEVAARSQIHDIIPVIYEALEKAHSSPSPTVSRPNIDAIAITYGPGLIGSLLVGVETAKTLSYIWNIPLIPVNHLFGHLYANWIAAHNQKSENISFPAIGLIVSGAHTDLVLMKSHDEIVWLGGTRDDAAGEAFDKIGRMLGLSYPAGPMIEKLAREGNPKAFRFPRPLMHDGALDFSFSGLKTSVLRVVEKIKNPTPQDIADICRGAQDAIIDVIITKTLQAAKQYNAASIVLGGGVTANQTLTETLQQSAISQGVSAKIYHPEKSLSTDNAAMIGAAAVFHQQKQSWQRIVANPELYFD